MRTHTTLKSALALAAIALLALPGEAKTVDAAPSRAAGPIASAPDGQRVFGLLLDPHAAPVLHIELPAGYWTM